MTLSELSTTCERKTTKQTPIAHRLILIPYAPPLLAHLPLLLPSMPQQVHVSLQCVRLSTLNAPSHESANVTLDTCSCTILRVILIDPNNDLTSSDSFSKQMHRFEGLTDRWFTEAQPRVDD
eukprot:TRINITY_DN5065_c0_g3_i1.p1 TRINITY_DN5065_c0_g3~~TRINITY_DN5065_c0_g3_i1.p1  ORF type:complete len:122 (-),score=6.60 TRINITY_DN5065_c0_g3_i1:95-460(-)